MGLSRHTTEKSEENIHIESISGSGRAAEYAKVQVEGEIFHGMNKQTILALLVCFRCSQTDTCTK